MESASDPEVEENPDVWKLFRHYDELYFRGALDDAAFAVEWTSPRMRTCSGFGSCSFGEMSKTITLYQPMLQHRTKADLKNALLHLMIHAIVFVKYGFTKLRDQKVAIVSPPPMISVRKRSRASRDLWKCESCDVTLLRATKLGPPSDSCCIENVSQHSTCGNMLCHWHNHKTNCGGTYVVPAKRGQKMVPKGYAVGCKRGFLTETSNSQDAVQESDSDEVRENSIVPKPNTEGKLLSQMGGRNAKSPGSSSPRKASKRKTTEDFQKAIVPATPQRKLKLKKEFASEKHELFSIGGCNNAKSHGGCSSKKAEGFQKAIVSSASPLSKPKREKTSVASEKHELRSVESLCNAKSLGGCSSKKAEDFQKAIVSSVSPLSKLKRKQTSVASEKHELRSVESIYDNAKSSRSEISRKASRWHKPEHVQKSNVQPGASQKKVKLEEDMTLSERYGVSSLGSYKNAKPPGSSTSRKASTWHKPKGVEKSSIALPPSTKELKLEQDFVDKHGDTKPVGSSTRNKEGKLNKPEGIQKASVLPASPPRKLKQNLVAPERPKTRSAAPERQKTRTVAPERKKTRSVAPGKKKEYACFSVWANIYESECSSGSAEPLVNKRTERRKREKERAAQLAYSRSRKRSASGTIKAEPAEEEVSSQQAKSPPQSRLQFVLIDAADKVVTRDPRDQSKAPALRKGIVVVPPVGQVTTQTPRGQSQPPAQCMNIVKPPAGLVMTQTHGGPMDIAAVPPADQMMSRAPVHQSQPPAASAIAFAQVVPPHSADPHSLTPSNPSVICNPDVIDISDDD